MAGVDPVSLGLSAAMEVPKLIVGFSQLSKANKALKALGQEKYPEFGTSPEMMNAYQRAEAMSRYGYSPEERAQFNQDLSRNNSTAYRAATDMSGGQTSSAINTVLDANNVDAINKFASTGANLRRENMQYADTLAQRLQSQKNLQTQNAIARRQMLEQSYGAAKSAALENIAGGASGALAFGAQSALGNIQDPTIETISQSTEIIDAPVGEYR